MKLFKVSAFAVSVFYTILLPPVHADTFSFSNDVGGNSIFELGTIQGNNTFTVDRPLAYSGIGNVGITDGLDFTLASESIVTITASSETGFSPFINLYLNQGIGQLDSSVGNDGGTLTDDLPAGNYRLVYQGVLVANVGGYSDESYGGTINVSVAPEPSTYAMMLGGLALLGICVRRKLT